jgi:hypothetical protein
MKKQKAVYLQDFIMEGVIGRPLKKTERVIFLNNDTLDCRRDNLRLVDDAAPVTVQ